MQPSLFLFSYEICMHMFQKQQESRMGMFLMFLSSVAIGTESKDNTLHIALVNTILNNQMKLGGFKCALVFYLHNAIFRC